MSGVGPEGAWMITVSQWVEDREAAGGMRKQAVDDYRYATRGEADRAARGWEGKGFVVEVTPW